MTVPSFAPARTHAPRVVVALLVLVPTLLVLTAPRGAVAMPDQVVRAPGPAGPRALSAPDRSPYPARSRAEEAPRAGVWPLSPQPAVLRRFDPPQVTWGAGHRGVDLRGSVGQPVRAALAGEVVHAGPLAGRGVVSIDHGGLRTTYEPVAASVRRGERVERGRVIGTLGWSGGHCLPVACLHWGLRRGGTYLDPLTLVDAGPRPVRLHPW